MPTNIWTINRGDVNGGALGSNLVGCHINENTAGTAYQFTEPNITNVLSTSSTPLPTGAFDFPTFVYSGPTWAIHVSSLSTNQISGSWIATTYQLEGTSEESGDWTAQAGSGAGGDEDEPETATSTTA
jgi:hypothetical protein